MFKTWASIQGNQELFRRSIMRTLLFTALLLSLIFSLGGCGEEKSSMQPAATRENCNNKDLINSLDEKTRGYFHGKCSMHGLYGEKKPIKRSENPRTWNKL
jgi:entry exclusion lipoprotein TrbK